MSMVQAAPAGQAGGLAAILFQIFPFVIVFAIFYLLWIRPQQQRVKEHQASINAVKKGDDVVTGEEDTLDASATSDAHISVREL